MSMNRYYLELMIVMILFVPVSLSSTIIQQTLAGSTQMTFYNTTDDPAMIELSDSKANCIVQPHESCPLQTKPTYYTVNVCVTYCSADNLFLYTEYSVYGNCDIYLNQTSAINFTVTNRCPEKYKEIPKPQTLVLTTPDSQENNTKLTLLPSCGIQCHVGLNDSINQARDEIKKGNNTGALYHLQAAQRALNATEEDANVS
jgi:hypothetical protein